MSGTPAPRRLGRAVRGITPVALVAVLALPAAALADQPANPGKSGDAPGKSAEQHGNGNGKANGPKDKDQGKGNGNGNGNAGENGNGNGPKDKDKGKPSHPDHPTKPVEKPVKDDGEIGLGGGQQEHKPVGSDTITVVPPAGAVAMTIPSKSACTSKRRITIRLRPYSIRSAKVTLNGKRVKVRGKGKRATAVIDLRGKKAGTYVVRTTVVTKGGRIRMGTRRFKTCVQ